MTYQWSKNGTAMSGATSSSYTTPAETTSDNNATFSVTVSNSAGSAASSAAILTVNAAAVAPTITSQPASQTVNAGLTATFNVAATGNSSPMTYQVEYELGRNQPGQRRQPTRLRRKPHRTTTRNLPLR